MTKIFVGGLSERTDIKKLERLFSEHGKVEDVHLVGHKRIAFIKMDDADAVRAISALDGRSFDGRRLNVSEAISNRPGERGGREQRNAGVRDIQHQGRPHPGREFVNPYSFIPVKKVHEDAVLSFSGEDSHWQDKFRGSEHSSGRIVCEIEAESEIFVGAGVLEQPKDNPKTPAKVSSYELGGRPAIPPTSLKGMVSSVMEAASNSSLRVLENTVYTRRSDFGTEMLKNIGLIVRSSHTGGKNEFYIMPIKKGNPQRVPPAIIDYNYAVYLDGYDRRNKVATGFIGSFKPRDFSADPTHYYLDSRGIVPKISNGWFIGYKFDPGWRGTIIVDENTYNTLPGADKPHYKEGIFKVLGIGPEREEEIPGNKKHEFFLFTQNKNNPTLFLPIGPDALSDFNYISDDRSFSNKTSLRQAELLPFSPLGRQRQSKDGKDALRIRENDVVYYDARGSVVTRLSFSACWRDFCGDSRGSAYDYFRHVDDNGFLLPPCALNQKEAGKDPLKLKLTPVCSLMGFVEEEKHPDQSSAFALAGRLFFSPGVLSPGQNEKTVRGEEKTLKILDSPKPPCPEFYFYENGNPAKFITKRELGPGNKDYRPRGRKVYWHHKNENDPYAPDDQYKSDHYKQCLTIRPVKKGTKFLFSVDFYNLSEFELGMLLYALRPNDKFRHLVGLGKPIGLGAIKIEVLNLLFTYRHKRYSEDPLFDGSFFHSHTNHAHDRIAELAGCFKGTAYEREGFYGLRFCSNAKEESVKQADDFKNYFTDKITERYGKELLEAIERVGDPEATQGMAVRYPPNPADPDGFNEAYKWWMINAGRERNVTGSKRCLPDVLAGVNKKAPSLPFDPRR